MLIENPPDLRLDTHKINKFIRKGVIADTNILFILFISKYISCNKNKNYLLKKANITQQEVYCLEEIIKNLRISKLIITPQIFSEFINKIRRDLKQEYKEIKKDCSEEIVNKHGKT